MQTLLCSNGVRELNLLYYCCRKEEEALRKKQEEEEETRRQEQHKRQMEALKRLQEQQMKSRIAPWSQPSVTTGTSLADIQKLQEKEKKQVKSRKKFFYPV